MVTCIHAADLAVGASVAYQITVKVDADIVAGAGASCPTRPPSPCLAIPPADSTGNDTATETTNVVRKADLAITKTDVAIRSWPGPTWSTP